MKEEELIDAIFTKNNKELSKFIEDNFYKVKDNDYHSYVNKISLLEQLDKNVINYANNKMNAYDNHFSTVKDSSIIFTILTTLLSFYLNGIFSIEGWYEMKAYISLVVAGLLFAFVVGEYVKSRTIWINFMFFKDLLKTIK